MGGPLVGSSAEGVSSSSCLCWAVKLAPGAHVEGQVGHMGSHSIESLMLTVGLGILSLELICMWVWHVQFGDSGWSVPSAPTMRHNWGQQSRQFLIWKSHIGLSKAHVSISCTWICDGYRYLGDILIVEAFLYCFYHWSCHVARDAILKFRPNVNIKSYHTNVKDSHFNVDFFRKFNVVMNGLDNLDAIKHVNRLCLASEVPLVESAKTGFLNICGWLLHRGARCVHAGKWTRSPIAACWASGHPFLVIFCWTSSSTDMQGLFSIGSGIWW